MLNLALIYIRYLEQFGGFALPLPIIFPYKKLETTSKKNFSYAANLEPCP